MTDEREVRCFLCAAPLFRDDEDRWRDRDGWTVCDHIVPNGPEDLHRPCVNPAANQEKP